MDVAGEVDSRKSLRPYVFVRHDDLVRERPAEATEDVHFARALVEAVLGDLTAPGDRILDPFAGFGTTLAVAAEMGRPAVGVELLPERCAAMRQRCPTQTVVAGDALDLAGLVDGPFDLCLTSPPFMTENEHPEDPLTGYTVEQGDYASYLQRLRDVCAQVASLMAPAGQVVLSVANLRVGGHFTPLAWDVARAVSDVLELRQDVFVCTDHRLADFMGDYLLVFGVRPPAAG